MGEQRIGQASLYRPSWFDAGLAFEVAFAVAIVAFIIVDMVI